MEQIKSKPCHLGEDLNLSDRCETSDDNSRSPFASNFDLYSAPDHVEQWAQETGLQPGEIQILEVLRGALSDIDMLDLGVGGGRTSEHFAPLVRSYVGTDLVPAMVETCIRRFPHLTWSVTNATDLKQFSDRSFDFVLFSYNGLDLVDARDRETALQEMYRVLRSGGYLAFSSHNMHFFPVLQESRRIRLQYRPRALARSIKSYLLFQLRNRHVVYHDGLSSAVVYEGQLGYSAPTYYSHPRWQVGVLREIGLSEVRVFPSSGGEVSADGPDLDSIADPWLYYLSRKE